MDNIAKAKELIERLRQGGNVTDLEISEIDTFSILFSGEEFCKESKILIGRLNEIRSKRA